MPVQRFQCKDCERCFNWLPPFLLPRKHYTIPEIEPGIEAYVTGSDGYTKTFQAKEDLPCCQETLWRWVDTFAVMAKELHSIARTALAKFKSSFKFEKDKRLFAADFPSALSRLKNQNLNLLYQLFILREYFTSLVEPKDFLVWLIFQKRLTAGEKSAPTMYRNGTWPTRFANDQNRLKRDNNPQPP